MRLLFRKCYPILKKVQKYSDGMTYDMFLENELVAEACVFNLGQLGELANKADADFRKQYAEIPWSQIYGLWNRIVHDYEGVNLRLVWEIISEDLPELRNALQLL